MLSKSYRHLIKDKNKTTTGNWADYNTCKPYVCCGAMDLHDDSDNNDGKKHFSIKAEYWNPAYSLVCSDSEGKFYIAKRTSEVITFDSDQDHCFVPNKVAKALVETQDQNCKVYTDWYEKTDLLNTTPKLVWSWVN